MRTGNEDRWGSLDGGAVLLRRLFEQRWGHGDEEAAPPPHVIALGGADAVGADLSADSPAVFLTPRSVLIGPVGGGVQGPCPGCLAARWQRLRPMEERNVLETGGEFVGWRTLPFLTDFVVDALVGLWRTTAGRGRTATPSPTRTAEVLDLSLASLAVRSFPLLADSGCLQCFDKGPSTPDTALPDLVPRPKREPDEYRLRSAEEFGIDTEVFANPVCGALGETIHLDLASPTMAPATGVMRVSAGGRLLEVGWSGQTSTYGTSRVLGVFEGLERHAGTRQRRYSRTVNDSLDGLLARGLRALDPRECGVYEDEVYARSPRLVPFASDREMEWVWGYSLRDDRPILVPEQLVYYVRDGEPGAFVDECSNGCAVAGSPEEAVLHGLLELAERDAFLLGWYGAVPLPEVDPDSVRTPRTRHMIDRIRLHGYDVRLFDNRIDLPFPVVNAVGVRRDGGPGSLCFAAGSAMTAEGAVDSAVSEIATYIPSLATRLERRRPQIEAMARDFRQVRELADHPLLFALPDMAGNADFLLRPTRPRPLDELYADWEERRPRSSDLLDDLHRCVRILAGEGLDVIAVDQTSPEQEAVGLHNVSVVAPGLVPIDFGWDKQRVLASSRLRRVTGEADRVPNPVPHPFP